MAKKVPERKISEFNIPKETTKDLEMVSKITGMLAEKPDVLEKIGRTMKTLSDEYEMKLKQEVSTVIAKAIELEPKLMVDKWWWHIIQHYVDGWITIHLPHTDIWGPYDNYRLNDIQRRKLRG